MNKLTKIGASALAGSLVAFSVNAAEVSVGMGASITYNNSGADVTGNNFTMGDSVTFTASGETDGGLMITSSMEFDGAGPNGQDAHSISIGGDFGTLIFDGRDAATAMGAIDDTTPNAYEESWDVVSGADSAKIGGISAENKWIFNTNEMNGLSATFSYVRGDSSNANSNTSMAFKYTGVEGLTAGFGVEDDESSASVTVENSVMYAKYATGPITVGISMSESDSTAASADKEMEAAGITYAVNDDFTVGYNVSNIETTQNATDGDQEATGYSFSYTSGGMTLAGAINKVDNVGNTSGTNRDGAEIGVSFAF